MILKTQEFQKVASTILLAVDKNAGNLELSSDGQNPILSLAVTDKESYVKIDVPLQEVGYFNVVVDASLFLNLISGLTTEFFELSVEPTCLKIKSGKSKYKLPVILDNDKMMVLPKISIVNKTVEMEISNEILTSIININGKEIAKVKNLSVNELKKSYYITEGGCFTYTMGACWNEFALSQPVNLLLNDRIVKLLKLFKGNVKFTLGQDAISETLVQTKVCFEADGIYLAAITTCNDVLLNAIQKPYLAAKSFFNEVYDNHVVITAANLSAAISRLILFTKNCVDKVNALSIPAKIAFADGELSITDSLGNVEYVQLENDSRVQPDYSMIINIVDLKTILDSCKDSAITINCGNRRSVVIKKGQISWLLPEGQPDKKAD